MDRLTSDCPHCRSAGSIEFGLCQVCLREHGGPRMAEVAGADVLVTLSLPIPERAVGV